MQKNNNKFKTKSTGLERQLKNLSLSVVAPFGTSGSTTSTAPETFIIYPFPGDILIRGLLVVKSWLQTLILCLRNRKEYRVG